MEDKKCRICGFADMANPNIFQSNTKLVEKIVAVFPIVLYPNDPLPKHICKKCMLSTSTMYADIERAMRNQNKWISNVRSVQPDNVYVKVVDSIEGANRQTAQLVSKVAGEEIGERTVCHLLNFKIDETNPQTKSHCNNKPEVATTMDKSTSASFRSEKDFEISHLNTEHKSLPRPASFKTSAITAPTKITQLKTVLELNGCTLTKLKPTVKPSPQEKPIEIEQIKVEVEIKEEPEDVFLEEVPQYSVICKLCSFQCETVEELAIHQLNHLTLSVPRLLEKKYLDKRTRRGRLIRVEAKKCIRCLNCWRIFVDNKSILHHWSNGDCDFYCLICGKEFPTSPKMLRDHVPAAHGINFRSSRLLRRPPVPLKKAMKSESALTSVSKSVEKILPTEALSVKVACNICMKVFANFKARNSHMRAHKHPPFLPAQPPPSLSETLLQFNRTNQIPIKEEIQDYDDIPYHIVRSLDTTAPSTSRAVPPICPMNPLLHPPPKIIPHRPQKSELRSNSPAGIRTKFVQIRPNPHSTGFKSEPDLSSSSLKVKSLIDLQDPAVTSQQLENADKSSLRTIPTAASSVNGGPTTNGLGMAIAPKDNMNYGQIFNCHPCGGKFSSKLELFRHKRKCTANNLFPCQFCSRYFLTSADLQMHIMLLHKSTSPQ